MGGSYRHGHVGVDAGLQVLRCVEGVIEGILGHVKPQFVSAGGRVGEALRDDTIGADIPDLVTVGQHPERGGYVSTGVVGFPGLPGERPTGVGGVGENPAEGDDDRGLEAGVLNQLGVQGQTKRQRGGEEEFQLHD